MTRRTPADKAEASRTINEALLARWAGFEIAERLPLEEIAAANERVESPARPGRVVVTWPCRGASLSSDSRWRSGRRSVRRARDYRDEQPAMLGASIDRPSAAIVETPVSDRGTFDGLTQFGFLGSAANASCRF